MGKSIVGGGFQIAKPLNLTPKIIIIHYRVELEVTPKKCVFSKIIPPVRLEMILRREI